MIMLGGLTRLTQSGLSMVEWKPITGIFPPISEASWQETFVKYKKTPEFQQVNYDMSLSEYKRIYVIEYIHRMFGRLIALVLFIPLFVFKFKGYLSTAQFKKCLGLGLIVCIQGAVGWYMVKSGLVKNPLVSHLRLAFHLTLAAFIFMFSFWMTLKQFFPDKGYKDTRALGNCFKTLIGLIILQIASGGLVAGLKAGFAMSPLFKGGLANVWISEDGLGNLANNPVTVLFIHLLLATVVLFLTTAFCVHSLLVERGGKSASLLMSMVFIQVFLGVFTLLNFSKGVPVVLANIHQGVGFLLFSAALFHYFIIRCRTPAV